ncbi:hypothetical protein J437_LFUL009932 [Ladona fulva]|uniref:Uncharacterized protein n=1 Tax=Ladona fulva TaxID=123851 RepID=A0A8K0P1V0_LADFU|nr:hypothetical protein J437_LFUL009932 [Ladona fulva]
MAQHLTDFALKYNYISDNQFGFLQKIGTNLRKALNIVNHEILVKKLYNMGVKGNMHKWFRKLKLNDHVNECVNVAVGVPQGQF